MKIPKSVKVGAHRIETVFKAHPKVGGRECWGTFTASKGLIELQTGLPAGRTQETWVHEILHAIEQDRSIGLSERQVSQLAPAIYTFLKDNGYV